MIVALLIAILDTLLTLVLIVAVVKYLEQRKEQAGGGDAKDTEVFYTDWHVFGYGGFIHKECAEMKHVLSIKGNYKLHDVIFETKVREGSSYVRAKMIFKKVDKDEHN